MEELSAIITNHPLGVTINISGIKKLLDSSVCGYLSHYDHRMTRIEGFHEHEWCNFCILDEFIGCGTHMFTTESMNLITTKGTNCCLRFIVTLAFDGGRHLLYGSTCSVTKINDLASHSLNKSAKINQEMDLHGTDGGRLIHSETLRFLDEPRHVEAGIIHQVMYCGRPPRPMM